MSKTTDHKEGKATVKIIYRTNKVLKGDLHPFLVRVTKNREQRFVSTGLALHPDYWNEKKTELRDRIRTKYPEPHREKLLTELRKWEDKYRQAADELADADIPHTVDDVLAKAIEGRKQTRRVLLLAYFEELAAEKVAAGKLGNAGVYRDCANQLRKFIKDEYHVADVPFDRVTVTFCEEWERTLCASGNGATTLSARFRTLAAVLNRAIASGAMKADRYPFSRPGASLHKFKVSKFDVSTKPRAISSEAVKRLELLPTSTSGQRLAKEVFMFSFHCGGISFVDLAQLRWSDLSSDTPGVAYEWLHYTRQKTGGSIDVPLQAPAVALLTAYRPLTYATPASYVFPILDPARHITPTQIKNRLHKVLGQVNQDLKTLGEAAGISTTLTTYVARHSFATVLRKRNQPIGVISQLMGHKSEAVTAVYLDSFGTDRMKSAYATLLD